MILPRVWVHNLVDLKPGALPDPAFDPAELGLTVAALTPPLRGFEWLVGS